MKQFVQGQTVRIEVRFKNFAGTLADPDFIQMWTEREADGVQATETYDDGSSSSDSDSSIVRDSEGIYHWDVDTTEQSGIWKWRVVGQGTVPNASQGSFYVEPHNIEESDSSSS